MGKIQDTSVDRGQASGVKKAFRGYRKKEGESSALYSKKGKGKYQEYDHQVAAVTIPATAAPQRQTYAPRQGNQQRPKGPPKKFDQLPMSYTDVFNYLVSLKMIELRPWKLDPTKLPYNFDANARCAYHSDGQGHTTENCIALKYKVQELLDTEAINFGPPPTPNVIQQPLPNHGGPTANAIYGDEGLNLVMNVDQLIVPLMWVKEQLVRQGEFPVCGLDCKDCLVQHDGCESLKKEIQSLIEKKTLQFQRVFVNAQSAMDEVDIVTIPVPPKKAPVMIPVPAKRSPVTITLPGPVPYSNERAIPWHYGAQVYHDGKKLNVDSPSDQDKDKPEIDDITGESRLTRSGRIYPLPEAIAEARARLKEKGKGVVTESSESVPKVPTPIVSPDLNKDATELMRYIRKSDYKIIDQLGQTPAKISILALLRDSEPHRNALMN